MSYSEDLRHIRRLVILRHLAGLEGHVSSASILQDVLCGQTLPSSYDAVLAEISWLVEQGLVVADTSAEFVVVTATRRGVDLSKGLATHPGVARVHPRL